MQHVLLRGFIVFSHYYSKYTFQITANALSASIKNNIKRFVLCSSMARYGSRKTPFDESMECKHKTLVILNMLRTFSRKFMQPII